MALRKKPSGRKPKTIKLRQYANKAEKLLNSHSFSAVKELRKLKKDRKGLLVLTTIARAPLKPGTMAEPRHSIRPWLVRNSFLLLGEMKAKPALPFMQEMVRQGQQSRSREKITRAIYAAEGLFNFARYGGKSEPLKFFLERFVRQEAFRGRFTKDVVSKGIIALGEMRSAKSIGLLKEVALKGGQLTSKASLKALARIASMASIKTLTEIAVERPSKRQEALSLLNALAEGRIKTYNQQPIRINEAVRARAKIASGNIKKLA